MDETSQRRSNQENCNSESDLQMSSRLRPTLLVAPLPAILVGYVSWYQFYITTSGRDTRHQPCLWPFLVAGIKTPCLPSFAFENIAVLWIRLLFILLGKLFCKHIVFHLEDMPIFLFNYFDFLATILVWAILPFLFHTQFVEMIGSSSYYFSRGCKI